MSLLAQAAAGAFVLLLLASVVAWLAGPPLAAAWRRRRITRLPFPAAWRDILRRRLPLYGRLPADLQLRLKKRVQVLLAEVPIVGCRGLVVNDEQRLLVAAQAALLLLARGRWGFAALRQIQLYPGAFVVERERPGADGLVHASRQALDGESWQQGLVLLAWDAVLAGAADPFDGDNVVIHEFAHQLDQAEGGANGAPWLPPGPRRARWAAVLGAEFEALGRRLARGEGGGLLGAYAAQDPAEFFAVASERYFERGAELERAHPALFAELAQLYGVDPRPWAA